jgi:hypothetical protein
MNTKMLYLCLTCAVIIFAIRVFAAPTENQDLKHVAKLHINYLKFGLANPWGPLTLGR